MTFRLAKHCAAAALVAAAFLKPPAIDARAALQSAEDTKTAAAPSNPGLSRQVAELRALQATDQRVADVAWLLLANAGDLCPEKGPATGISVHSADQYSPTTRRGAAAAFGFSDKYPSVLSVARGSPAELAGILANDVLQSINGQSVAGRSSNEEAASYGQIDRVMRVLEGLPAGQTTTLSVIRKGVPLTLQLTPVTACKSRVELVPGPAVNGSANGYVAQISGGIAEWAQNDDELALVIGHEVGHNILGHQDEIERTGIQTGLFGGMGKSGRRLREMERDADRVGTWLAARAGFNYRIAPVMWDRLSRRAGIGALIATTHPSPNNRRQSLEAVVAEIAKAQATIQKATLKQTSADYPQGLAP